MSVAVVVGVAEGLGASLCRTFANRHYAVGALCRTPRVLETLPGERLDARTSRSVVCDVDDPDSVRDAFVDVERTLGVPQIVVHNAGAFSHAPFLESSLDAFERAWRVSARGAWLVARQALPAMLKRGSGALLLSGATASVRGSGGFSALASSKFALRGLAQSLAREFGPRGIHVAHIVVDGVIWCPWTRARFDLEQARSIDPDALATIFADLAEQSASAWVHELDVRPSGEKV